MLCGIMKIRNVIHKGLRKLIEDDNAAGLQPVVANKLRKIVSFLQEMEKVDVLRSIPVWKAHQLERFPNWMNREGFPNQF